jgi:hypothetical protein
MQKLARGYRRDIRVKYCKQIICAQNIAKTGVTEIEVGACGGVARSFSTRGFRGIIPFISVKGWARLDVTSGKAWDVENEEEVNVEELSAGNSQLVILSEVFLRSSPLLPRLWLEPERVFSVLQEGPDRGIPLLAKAGRSGAPGY